MKKQTHLRRIANFIRESVRPHGWKCSDCLSKTSMSRYLFCRKGDRLIEIRISDHHPAWSRPCRYYCVYQMQDAQELVDQLLKED